MGSGTIKGINLEIGGSTEPLNRSLENTNKISKNLQSELKQVERLLKFDPTNITLLAQKQELLSKTVQNTADKVNVLGKAQKQVEESFQLKKISEEQYRAFQRELINAENELKKSAEAANEFNKKLEGEAKALLSVDDTLNEVRQGYNSLDKSLVDVKQEIDKTAKATDKLNDENEKSKGKISSMTIAFGSFIANGLQKAIEKISQLIDKTKEFRQDFAKLETNAKLAGVSLEATNSALRKLYALTGENDSNIEALSNLLSTKFSENQMLEVIESLSGAVIRFPDTLKIESLADSLQETLATGNATGQFEEMLGRVGVNVDKFEKSLQRSIKAGTAQQFVLDTLARTGLAKVNEEFEKTHKGMIDNSKAEYDLNKSMAELSKTLEPLSTEILQKINAFLSENGEMIKSIAKLIMSIIGVIITLLGVIAKINPQVLLAITSLITVSVIIFQIIKVVKEMSEMGGKIGGFFSKIDIQVLKTTAIILGIVAALIALVAIIAVLTGKGPDVERTMSSISKGVNGIASPGSLPHNDTGTSFWRGGPTYINERGGEIAVLPSGSQIIPHDISMAIAQGRGNQNITVNVNAHDLQQVSDVVNLFEGYKQYMRAR